MNRLQTVRSRTYRVRRSLLVHAGPERIFPLLADFHAWPLWSPWEGIDPHLRRDYTGAESGVGASFGWSGNRRAGRGRMEIVDAVEPTGLRIACAYERPLASANTTSFDLRPVDDGTEVTWTVRGTKTRPLMLLGLVRTMDARLGPAFDRGLARLKAVAEQEPPTVA